MQLGSTLKDKIADCSIVKLIAIQQFDSSNMLKQLIQKIIETIAPKPSPAYAKVPANR